MPASQKSECSLSPSQGIIFALIIDDVGCGF